MMKLRFCLKCFKPFIVIHKRGLERKFCCSRCKDKYNSMKTYERLKNDENYKKMKYETSKKWRLENREYFNNLVREKSKLYRRKIIKYRRRNKLCFDCGMILNTSRSRCRCLKCLVKHESYKK